ncbi:uncharacterized protein LOC130444134 [Diorhabda sublineata]|uniref:uncharacterized protein LOC130444134 n=1 Tax=Diorhabda sublineata TaxID=1163346 RepID=UPI0024E0434B|nr:uncharacterized protein LOC130444134 [Diorhabda sublineata]
MGEEFEGEYGEEYAGFPDDEDDEMREVEKMIERASQELAQVADENRRLMETLDEAVELENDKAEFKYNPAVDSAIMKELEDAECQAKETAKIIAELKLQVMELSKKETMTEDEAKELERKNLELKKQMIIFEKKTKRIQELLAQTNLFEDLGSFKPARYNEDVLPKVVVCGMTENQMPKILICDDNKNKCKSERKKRSPSPKSPKSPCDCPQPTTGNLDFEDFAPSTLSSATQGTTAYQQPSQGMQQGMLPYQGMQQGMVLPQMGMGLPGGMPPQNTCECHQPQMGQQMGSPGMMSQPMPMSPMSMPPMSIPPMSMPPLIGDSQDYCECDNAKDSSRSKTKSGPGVGMPCGKGRGICPAEIESRLQEYSENTQFLEKQLYDMESEVKEMHQELLAVQKEREHLEHHKKMLCAMPPCGYSPCPVSPCPPSPCPLQPCPGSPCPASPCFPPCGPPCESQLRELREQYKRLQDDFKNKLTEVAGLRTENEKLKEKTKLAEDAKREAEKQARDLELEIKRLKGTLKDPKQISKEQVIELEQQLTVAKQRFREAQDELEELRLLVEDQQSQLDDYRNKYLEAQQQVEEQRRQIDLMEIENQRISEQVNLEIQRVKNQFQEKLQELMPLPDILKSTQMKLQEAQQMHLLAERNNESIARELQMYKDKIAAMNNQIDEVRSDQQFGEDAKAVLEAKVKELEERLAEVQELNSSLLTDLEKLTEKSDEYEKLAEERLHEIIQLESQLESLREETARQVSRIKDRCEIVRRSMQKQICDLERQLAQSRALAKTAQKDRDEIRQKMQAQINNLNENFEDAQMRIRNLQGHVNFLRNSYGDVYNGDDNIACKPPAPPDPCTCNPAY